MVGSFVGGGDVLISILQQMIHVSGTTKIF